jgi:hypothetical protein
MRSDLTERQSSGGSTATSTDGVLATKQVQDGRQLLTEMLAAPLT